MPVIRIDDDVWQWLKAEAEPLVDTPNSVLRRLAGLDRAKAADENATRGKGRRMRTRSGSGRELNRRWGVGARHALYREDGSWYHHLNEFPGALFDAHGYVVFKTEAEYFSSPYLQHGEELHVPGGITSIPGYIRMT
jgi:5-methylcytosine-specific restriction protein A